MCGIAGAFGFDQQKMEAAVATMNRSLAHRGPDAEGQVSVSVGDQCLCLGHRRLSILDLSALGTQPMRHERSGSLLTFNGEIFNYRRLRDQLEREGEVFQGHSDTEVLLAGLALYGQQFLDRLEGMFAFAFYDPRLRSLLLARDPAGIKPLYLARTATAFVFASEVKAILTSGLIQRKIDRRGIAGFLAYGAVQHPLTLFEGIGSLAPGHFLALTIAAPDAGGNDLHSKPFWRLPDCRSATTEEQAVTELRQTVDAAVHDHLISDVPVGLFLSSGIDSTILAGLASRHSRTLRSFTVRFSDEPQFSEHGEAAQTAARFGLNHSEIELPSAAAEAALSDWLQAADQPSIDGLNTYFISRAVRRQGIAVALSGLGADELFGGYPSFWELPRLQQFARLTRRLPLMVRSGLANAASLGRSRTTNAKLNDMLRSDGTLRSLYLHRRRVMSDGQIHALGLQASELGLDTQFLPPDAACDIDWDGADRDPVRIISQLEFRLYEGNMLLRDADVNGMAFGLEIRVPFLDRRLLDLAHSLPGSVRSPAPVVGKHLLRKAFADILNHCTAPGPKRGFTLPICRWMAGSLRGRCEQALDILKDSALLLPDGIENVWHSFLQEPDSPAWTRAFALVVLGEFCRASAA